MIDKIILSYLVLTGTPTLTESPTKNNENHAYKEIHTDELKTWYDQGKTMVVIDVRGDSFDGTVLPNAIWVPYNTSDENLQQMLPSKNALIVVYCANPTCPVSGLVVNRLIDHGYTDIYKYPEGIRGWVQQGLPIEKLN